VWRSVRAASLINRMLAFDWKYTLADNDVPKVVGATNMAGVDVAFPLLCDELVEFSLGLPPEWKLRRLTLRWVFKEALRGFLPDETLAKRKHGFGLPFGVWATQHERLQRLAGAALADFGARNVMRADFLRDLVAHWLPAHPGYYGELVWIVMILEHWLQAHDPDWRFEPEH
jgi:asparagine synthase (glutamine-hydrolysing)